MLDLKSPAFASHHAFDDDAARIAAARDPVVTGITTGQEHLIEVPLTDPSGGAWI